MSYVHPLTIKRFGNLMLIGLSFLFLESHQVPQDSGSVEFESEESHNNRHVKVAIIGAGVGGSSAAFYTRKLFGSSVSIDVFERANVTGGRVAIINMDGKTYEAGGAVIHDSNRYMKNLLKFGGLSKIDDKDLPHGKLAFYNGKTMYVVDSVASFYKRYGYDLVNINQTLSGFLKEFQQIYREQDKGKAFETVEDMLSTIGGHFIKNSTNMTARMALHNYGMSDKFINEFAAAATLMSYGQDMDVNAFVGMVSLLGAQGGKIWAVKDGNLQVTQRTLQRVKANVYLEHKVGKIQKITEQNEAEKYQIYDVEGQKLGQYDAVIVASPLEVSGTSLQCQGCFKWPQMDKKQHFQRTVVTLVHGIVNPKTFGYQKSEDVPENILATQKTGLYFRSLTLDPSTVGMTHKGSKVKGPRHYKVFSGDHLTNQQLSELFIKVLNAKVVDWLAYPKFNPPERFTSFVLDDGLFYVNAIERAASAMEMSAIAGRNAALLCKKYVDKKYGVK